MKIKWNARLPAGESGLAEWTRRQDASVPRKMETHTQLTLETLAVGSRLIVRTRVEWRMAAIARITEERVVLTVCSPSGRTYRLRRDTKSEIAMDGTIPVLVHQASDNWRENLSRCDVRW